MKFTNRIYNIYSIPESALFSIILTNQYFSFWILNLACVPQGVLIPTFRNTTVDPCGGDDVRLGSSYSKHYKND